MVLLAASIFLVSAGFGYLSTASPWGIVGALFVTVVFVFSSYAPRQLQSSFALLVRSIKHILWRQHSEPTFDFTKIDDGLYLGRMPRNVQDLELLKKEGITSLIILNENWELSVSLDEKATHFDVLHLPTPDYFSPTPEQIERGVRLIEQKHKENGVVYVHCFAGKGRSAVVVICYLIWKYKFDPEEAWRFVKGKRHIVANLPGLMGIRPQWKALNQWYKQYYGQQIVK